MKHRTPKLSSIEKALKILLLFNQQNRGMGTSEISQKLNLHPATASRIIKILCQESFLQHNNKSKKFSLGSSVFFLGKSILKSISGNLLNIAMPILIELCEEIGETVVLEIMSNENLVVTYIAQGRNSLSVKPNIGDILPIHASPGGKAILAFSPLNIVEKLLDKKLEAFTEFTITDKNKLLTQLGEIRKNGVAFCKEEMVIGVNTIGIPIFNHENKPIAAIVIAGPSTRVKCEINSPLVIALKKAAKEISSQLYHQNSLEKD